MTAGLSCYTANLERYLAGEFDSAAVVGRSVRLAVRATEVGLVFSHHAPSLDHLPDGTRFEYAAVTAADTEDALRQEIRRYGRALVVADAARLPWSVAFGAAHAPHWLLVTGAEADHYLVEDAFEALLPQGTQQPYLGTVARSALRTAITGLPEWDAPQRVRNEMAFGARISLPGTTTGSILLRRVLGSGEERAPESGLIEDDSLVLPLLMNRLADEGPAAARHLPDIWAAAGHRAFAHRWRALAGDTETELATAELWGALPRWVQMAVESAARGRPRWGVARAAVDAILRADAPKTGRTA
ncbi:hypothetical protein [Amycolatopsis alba]|uniref:Uncharacterized protein n=1 Tax=Amycolatopsis alba DSM 44262 TaxID=1125972 RepID=A0A229RST5_AMYAL|nr:hypothetical protein [Amycolatopsis alba]OXM49733.1 hypothetical protein CFP75_18355 [Amycolatopsis alba DSM 44262]